jgi:2',3'-cyclic-nucleotide 2'-phosphodiesterase (5'-nucleotidase family)
MSKTIDSILGESPVIGQLKHVDPIPKNNLIEENPWADFVSDAVRKNLDADVVLINSANFRGSVDYGTVTERDISSIFPFNNKLYKVKLSEKDLVGAISQCAKSLQAKNSKPGLMQVSGLAYSVNSQGELQSLIYTDKQGEKHSIDVNNPDPNKYYTAVYDEFLIGGGDNLEMLKKEGNDIIEHYPFDKDKVTIDYIKQIAQPFEVRKDGRISVIDNLIV